MKERVDSTKILREPNMNVSGQDAGVVATLTKIDAADIKAEVKDDDGRKSNDLRSPASRKIPNGDAEIKTENGKPGSVGVESQKSSPQASTPHSSGGNTPTTLMSQHGLMTSLDPPFMQQQSEIFVFSTSLANEAAENVRLGHCKSIIQFHLEHPNTKAFLQKNPLKANNFRTSFPPGAMGGMKCQQGPGMMRMPGPSPTCWGPQHQAGMEGMVMPDGMMPNGPYHPGGPRSRMMGGWPGPHMPMGPGGYPLGNMMDLDSEMMMGGPNNLSSSQIPDENLTIEQRQHRSRGLAQLTKIHKMLMGSANQHDGRQTPMGHDGHPAMPGMYPGAGPGMMTSQQQAMMSQHAMMSQSGMMPPHLSPQHQHMMSQHAMGPYGSRGPPGMGPPGMNGKDQYQAQHDWFHIQREYYLEKQHRMQHMVPGRMPQMEPGPPPPYYSSISQKHGGMGSPPPAGMNGMRMQMPPMGPAMDPEGMGMYGGPPEMCRSSHCASEMCRASHGPADLCRPPHIGMEPMPGMHGYPPHMMPGGPMDPGFDPSLIGGMPPGMGPGHPGPGGPRHHGPMRPGHMMGANGMMPGMKGANQVTLHRAGNPEQFNPETMGGVVPPVIPTPSSTSNSSKPPPSYAQAQKRKRGSDLDDSYTKGNLQQTPSPTKIHYHLSQFEGQELTITKQLNSAYVAGEGGDESSTTSSVGSNNSSSCPLTGSSGGHANSPLHGPGSNKGPHSNSSQNSSHMVSSPAISTTGPSPHQGPATPHSLSHPSSLPSSGAGIRFSHLESTQLSNGVGGSTHLTAHKPSSMSNITSASLANLAKGVENLSNQMQQNMMQGGPFHSIQVQGQMTATNNSNNCSISCSSSSNSSNSSNSNISSCNNNLGTCLATTTVSVTSLSSPPVNSSTLSGSAVTSQAPGLQQGVSNTYAAPNMTPSQVSMPPHHPPMNSYGNMHNIHNDSANMNMPPCSMQHGNMGPHIVPGSLGGGPVIMGPGCGMTGGGGGSTRSGMPHHMPHMQGQMAAAASGHSPVLGPSPTMPQSSNLNQLGPARPHRTSSTSSMPATPPTMTKGQFTSPPLTQSQMSGPGSIPDVASPSFPISSSSNSSVQIQQKGHNTIQYLPANPPSSQAASAKPRSDISYNIPRFPSPVHSIEGKNPSSTLQYFPSSSPPPTKMSHTSTRPSHMSSALSAAAAMGPEFASQATIAMHQSATMMRSPSIPDLQALQGPGPPIAPSPLSQMGPSPLVAGPDPMMGMSLMRPGHSPGVMHPMTPCMGPSSLECVSPIPSMGGYMTNGPTIEQAQAQAQAHAAMMMQGNSHIPSSSAHGVMPSCGDSLPHMTPMGPMPSCGDPSQHMTSMGPMPPCSGPSPHGPSMVSLSGVSMHGSMPPGMTGPPMHGAPLTGQPPHSGMSCPIPGTSPHGSMQGPPLHGPMPGPSPHHSAMMGGPLPGPAPHPSLMGPMPPHGHMHGMVMSSAGMPRQPMMGGMRMGGQYGMQYPGYQQDYYAPRGHPRQMMPSMMGPGQPYGMMSGMPGPG